MGLAITLRLAVQHERRLAIITSVAALIAYHEGVVIPKFVDGTQENQCGPASTRRCGNACRHSSC